MIVSQPSDSRVNKTQLNYHSLVSNYIYHDLIKIFLEPNLNDDYSIRIESLQTEKADFQAKAEEIAKKYNATLIISSEIDQFSITNHILIVEKVIESNLPDNFKNVHGNTIEFGNNDPSNIIKDDGIKQAKYLVAHSLGLIFYYQEDYEKAIKFFDFAVKFLPPSIDTSPSYLMLGDSYIKQNSTDIKSIKKAISAYEKAIEQNSGQHLYQAYKSIGYWTLYGLDQPDKAIEYYTKAIKIEESAPEAYEYRGRAFYQNSKFDLAIADFKKAIEFNINEQSLSKINTLLGHSYYQQGKINDAIEKYKLAIKNELNNNDYARFSLSNIYYNQCKIQDAIDSYKKMQDNNLKQELYNKTNQFRTEQCLE